MALLSRQAEKLVIRRDLAKLSRRPLDELAFIGRSVSAGAPLLLDTCVYIHQLKSKAPPGVDALIAARVVNHSVVAVQELLHLVGALDPADPRTRTNVAAVRRLLDAIPSHRLTSPSQSVMCDAAVYAGIVCRLQGYAKDRRMRALQDCTLFLQARSLGLTLLTSNVGDFDLLQQMLAGGRVLFYETL